MTIEERLNRLEQKVFKKIKKNDYIKTKEILYRCFDEDNQLLTTVDVLSSDVLNQITEDVRVVKNNGIMYNNDILNGNWEDSIPRRILNNAFLDNYLEEDILNKMNNDYVRLLAKEEVETLDSNFHNVSKCYWTMTFKDYDSDNWARVFGVYGSSLPGRLSSWSVGSTAPGVRPVICLKSDVQFSGEGTKDSPYEIIK